MIFSGTRLHDVLTRGGRLARWRGAHFAKFLFLLVYVSSAEALVELDDLQIAEVSGSGLTFGWTDFRFLMDPSSYIEQAGTANANTCTAAGNVAGNYACMRRGDLRWFGLNVSAWGTTVGVAAATTAPWNTTWTTTGGGNMTQCDSAGINGLGCPRGGPIGLFAAHDNPYILRVADYAGDGTAATAIGNGIVTYQGNAGTGTWDGSSNAVTAGSRQTVLEWLAPTRQDYYRMSFWGEIETGRGGTVATGGCGSGPYVYSTQTTPCYHNGSLLKSQTIIQGSAAGSVLRFYKFTQTSTSPGLQSAYNPALGTAGCTSTDCAGKDGAGSAFANKTLAIVYESRLRGDFRFSVAQTETTPVLGTPVAFHATEGMHFRNVDAWFPLGQSLYQAIVIDMPRNTATNAPVTDGNFVLEMPVIPNRTAVFTRFYSLNTGSLGAAVPHTWDYGYATAHAAYLSNFPVTGSTANYMPARTAATIANYPAPDPNYFRTHGYSRWGDWAVCQGVGCRLPWEAVNTAAQARDGVGRNAWNSSGDGIFFIGTTDFNAYAYSVTAVDTRADNNQHSRLTYYGGTTSKSISAVQGGTQTVGTFNSCNATSGTDYATCGYGGDYLGAADQYRNSTGTTLGKDTTSTSIIPTERGWANTQSAGMGTATNRPVIAVPAGTALNIGDARIEGMQINLFKLSSLGAQY